MQTIGVIGGSGLYDLPGLTKVRKVRVRTPFGEPSDPYLVGQLGEARLVFLPRHGRGHRLLPTELNARANIWGFKKLGVERIISFSAVGSMREEIAPGHFVVIDQFIDRTRQRPQTFFGDGLVAHVQMADPVCSDLAKVLAEAARDSKVTVHEGGTYLCIEGPQFSTRAESQLYRSWGVSVIGMTNLPEARLAREAEICYATVALSTDYDCWHETEEDVTVDAVVSVMKHNVEAARAVVANAVKRLAEPRFCCCKDALKNAVMTSPELVPARTYKKLELLVGRYLPKPPARKKAARVRARSRSVAA
jgi:5'-methylthioadenosine phosphorylase